MPRIYSFKPRFCLEIPSDAIRCDRTTIYGNPFIIGIDGTRDQVCDKYEKWIWEDINFSLREKMVNELRGKDLICWCYPDRCHCETIIDIANSPE